MTHKTVPIEVTANIELIHASGIKEVLYGHKLTNEQRKLLISMFPVHSLTSPLDNTVQELREQVAELVEALEDVGAWINTLPAGTKSATAKGLMIDALLAKAKGMMG